MTATTYRLARGVRLKRDADGAAMLLVPEGIVTLSESAAAVLELVDGRRSPDEIVATLAERYDDPDGTLAHDAPALLDALVERGFVAR